MSRTRRLPPAALVLAGLALAGCGRADPEAAARDWFAAAQAGSAGAQWRLLVPGIRRVESRAAFLECQEHLGARRRLKSFALDKGGVKPGALIGRCFARLTFETGGGRTETAWHGLTVVRRGGRWWVLDTPAARQAANEAYLAGEPARATRLLQDVLRVNPLDAESLDLLGYVVRDNAALKNNLELAIEMHRQAVELEPRNPDWHISLGNDYRLLGWFRGAVTELKRANELDRRATTYVWLGVAHASLQEVGAAREAWNAALKLDPANAQAHAFLEKTR